MANETLPAERVHASVSTNGLRLGGALWVIAGVLCAGLLIFVFVGENRLAQNPGLSAMVLGGAVAAIPTGGLLLARRGLGVRAPALEGRVEVDGKGLARLIGTGPRRIISPPGTSRESGSSPTVRMPSRTGADLRPC